MNDVTLFGRLQDLGMPKAKAWDLTAKIRDVLHPVAAVAAAKVHAATKGLGAAAPNQATKTISLTLTGEKVGSAVGTAILPGVGTVIGGAVGAVVGAVGSLFGPAKEGQAAETWDNMVAEGYLRQQLGRAFDERYWAEAAKGMMDKGNNAWPGCGKDGYKNPDCFFGPLAQTIVKGYLAKTVPLSASTAQVYSSVVVPWLISGAGGIFTYAPYAAENAANGGVQQAMVTSAVDRYLAGLPITRADMVEYAGQGYTDHQPALNIALQSLLVPTPAPPSISKAVATAPAVKVPAPIAAAATRVAGPLIAAGAPPPTQAVAAANISPAPVAVIPPAAAAPAIMATATIAPLTPQQDTTAALLSSGLSDEGVNMVSPDAQQVVADVAANGVQQTAYGPPSTFDLSSLLIPGAIVLGLVLALS